MAHKALESHGFQSFPTVQTQRKKRKKVKERTQGGITTPEETPAPPVPQQVPKEKPQTGAGILGRQLLKRTEEQFPKAFDPATDVVPFLKKPPRELRPGESVPPEIQAQINQRTLDAEAAEVPTETFQEEAQANSVIIEMATASGNVKVFTNTQTGAFGDKKVPSGIIMPNGNVYFGNKKDIAKFMGILDEPFILGGDKTFKQIAQARQDRIENVKLAENVGLRRPTPAEIAEISIDDPDFGAAIKTAFGQAIAPAIGFGGTAFAAGTALGGPGVGGIAGGVAAASTFASSFYTEFTKELQVQNQGDIKALSLDIPETEKVLRSIIRAQNVNPTNKELHVENFDVALMNADIAHEQLNKLTNLDLEEFIKQANAGTRQMRRFILWDKPAGMREQLVNDFREALINPNPSLGLIPTAEQIPEL